MAIKASHKDPAVLMSDLSRKMLEKWDPEVFFTDLMKSYGTANNSISMALKNERGFNVASKQVDDKMARPDLAISLRAYFRFLKNDADVAPALEDLHQLKEANSPKHKFQFLICSGPTTLAMFDTVEHDSILIGYKDLPSFYSFMLPLLEGRKAKIVSDKEADRKACLKLTRLLDTLAEHNNIDENNMRKLNSFMVRILFCFFAEDTGVFDFGGENVFSNAFNKLVDKDGSNAPQFFADLFTVLNTKEDEREPLKNSIAQELLKFPYVNGGLFAETGYIPEFDIITRNQFTDCGHLSWKEISPAVFGSMFQGAMKKEERRNLGAHYTSEEFILNLIKPLFLDELYAQFEQLKQEAEPIKLTAAFHRKNSASRRKFYAFLERIGSMKLLDPACGCGNFLLVTYKELRDLENKVFEYINEGAFTDSYININQFYGIEIEDWPVEIAHVSMWLMQHLMNQAANSRFGSNIASIPLKTSATIVCANALTTDWNEVLPASECSYIIGNPPFGGASFQSEEQKEWLRAVYPAKYSLGMIDIVTGWFVKASDYMLQNKDIKSAFVSTNSICQGQQVETLWGLLLNKGVKINFAYKSFLWSNDAIGKAAVFCIIVGFSYSKENKSKLFSINPESKALETQECVQISPYLTDCKTPVIVSSRRNALDNAHTLVLGSMPADDGNLIFSFKEGRELLTDHPEVSPYLKKFIGSSELMNSEYRYCLWFKSEEEPQELGIPLVLERIEKVKEFRLASKKQATVKSASIAWRFKDVSKNPNPEKALVIPIVSSVNRKYLPMDFFKADYIVSNLAYIVPNASYYDFGILTSWMHKVWNNLTGGRLKSDIRYSKDMTFNTFVWPQVTEEQHNEIEELAKDVLRARARHKGEMSLGQLYNPETMPEDLKQAHEILDAAVERAYRAELFADDEERLAFLLGLYTDAITAEKKAEAEKAKAKPKAKTKPKAKSKPKAKAKA